MFNDKTVWFDEQLQWRSDWIHGDLDEPEILHMPTSGIYDIMSNETSIVITPTIVTDVVNVLANDKIKSISVFSVNGVCLENVTPDDNNATLNLGYLSSGVYFVEARTYNGASAVKQIIKR